MKKVINFADSGSFGCRGAVPGLIPIKNQRKRRKKRMKKRNKKSLKSYRKQGLLFSHHFLKMQVPQQKSHLADSLFFLNSGNMDCLGSEKAGDGRPLSDFVKSTYHMVHN